MVILLIRYSILELWKADLKKVNERAADALADPEKYPNLFPDFAFALQVHCIFYFVLPIDRLKKCFVKAGISKFPPYLIL